MPSKMHELNIGTENTENAVNKISENYKDMYFCKVDTSVWKNRLSTVFLLRFGIYIPVEIPAT